LYVVSAQTLFKYLKIFEFIVVDRAPFQGTFSILAPSQADTISVSFDIIFVLSQIILYNSFVLPVAKGSLCISNSPLSILLIFISF
jgi:hypothetical protein